MSRLHDLLWEKSGPLSDKNDVVSLWPIALVAMGFVALIITAQHWNLPH